MNNLVITDQDGKTIPTKELEKSQAHKTAKELQVNRAVGDLQFQVEKMVAIVDELGDRLIPVMSEASTKEPLDETKAQANPTPLGSDIQKYTLMLERSREQLRQLITRLEI